jgi:uracil-DNA glycosylase
MNVITDSQKNVDAYINFWALSGIDFSIDDTAENWFEQSKSKKASSQSQNEVTAQNKSAPDPAPMMGIPNVSIVDAAQWPTDLTELQSQIAAGIAFPGNHFGRRIAAHYGPLKPALMIVSDVPETEEIDANSLAAGRLGKFAASMAAMLKINHNQLYYSALATTRPGSGAIPTELYADLTAFFLHCCNVIQPRQILILGPAACQALLGTDFMKARGNLHYINHDVGNVAAITTFHPRTLLSNPALKAVAWQDLQMLTKKEC